VEQILRALADGTISGFSEGIRVKKTQELGAGAYVKKPYTIEKIARALQDELEN